MFGIFLTRTNKIIMNIQGVWRSMFGVISLRHKHQNRV
nr:MAG TPA: hypothetical protein [Caudoviricetes sp.]